MDVNKASLLIITFFFVFLTNKVCIAQSAKNQPENYSSLFFLEGKISLDSLTKYIHNRSGIRFSFNSAKVKSSKKITFSKGKYSLPTILKQIKKTTSLYYTFYSGYLVFDDNPHKQPQKQTISKKNIVSKSKLVERKKNNTQNKRVIVYNSKKGNVVNQKLVTSNNGKVPHKAFANIPNGDTIIFESKEISSSILIAKNTNANDVAKTIAVKKLSVDSNFNLKNSSLIFARSKKDTSAAKPLPLNSLIKDKNKLNLNYGFLWNINLPFYGFNEYFTGTNGKPQFYNGLIPGVWISKTLGKNDNELVLLIKPEQQYFTGNKMIASKTSPISLIDTTLVQNNTSILKTNTLYVGLQYNYHISQKWDVSIGFNQHWQHRALVNRQVKRVSNGVVLLDSLYEIKKSSPDWQYIKNTFATGNIAVAYNLKKMQIGTTFFISITNILTSSSANIKPVNLHLFVRWRIK